MCHRDRQPPCGAGRASSSAVATDAATYFFDPAPLRNLLTLDADEWPGERYTRGDRVLHIELRDWADVFAIAPLDANTLAKLAWCLDAEQYEVVLDEGVRQKAERSLRRMLDLSGGWRAPTAEEAALEEAGVRPGGCGCA